MEDNYSASKPKFDARMPRSRLLVAQAHLIFQANIANDYDMMFKACQNIDLMCNGYNSKEDQTKIEEAFSLANKKLNMYNNKRNKFPEMYVREQLVTLSRLVLSIYKDHFLLSTSQDEVELDEDDLA